jgi:transposase
MKARQEKSATIVATLFDLWKELPRLSGKSKLAGMIRHATSRRVALERFLSDGRIEIDSNTVERAIRPQTTTIGPRLARDGPGAAMCSPR